LLRGRCNKAGLHVQFIVSTDRGFTMTTLSRLTAALTGAVAALGAQAARPPLYDDFSGSGIDRGKWVETETWRYIANGKAKLGRWIYGGTSSDSGVTFESLSLSLSASAPPKSLGATIKVTDVSINEGCPFNASPSRPRARIIAAYFNIRPGGPLPGDRTGDVLGLVQLIRASNSTDPQGVLQVQGVVAECTTADCSGATSLYFAPLGTVQTGTAAVVQVDWDKKNNLFRFTRDKTTVVEQPYTEVDSVGPSLPFANVSLRNEAANCLSGPRAKTGIAAEFDDVRLNP
jgi:hypothetical protein